MAGALNRRTNDGSDSRGGPTTLTPSTRGPTTPPKPPGSFSCALLSERSPVLFWSGRGLSGNIALFWAGFLPGSGFLASCRRAGRCCCAELGGCALRGKPAVAATAWSPIRSCPANIICPTQPVGPGAVPGGDPPSAAITAALPTTARARTTAAGPGSTAEPGERTPDASRFGTSTPVRTRERRTGDTTGVAGCGGTVLERHGHSRRRMAAEASRMRLRPVTDALPVQRASPFHPNDSSGWDCHTARPHWTIPVARATYEIPDHLRCIGLSEDNSESHQRRTHELVPTFDIGNLSRPP